MTHEANSNTPFDARRSRWAAVLVGIGVMAALDEIVFHQLLQWHHFFDFSTPAFGILSDGLLHAFELLAVVVGVFLLLDLSQRKRLSVAWAKAGFFLGMGGFQLFDGVINHKLLRLHQIRYGVDPLMYDLVWNAFALLFLLIGAWLWRRARIAR
ncbi:MULTISPECIES: DUF2243 domain-containing protein [unclassified Halomonas]|uniref:DUF2243 domain-containing protein n=1 Tax=unclassified Halomonas TaxID=2609666 RepID=UPI0020A03449|nr:MULTISPECIES: DUF2243 domain-containing protein [unclassified Halomonas]MCP1315515.1 DUF2243 domain-containing protein [Halomonas sp. 707D7]MCP1328117.1 DUF2243 domain-containing protein [Halomonas sp. 707D4]